MLGVVHRQLSVPANSMTKVYQDFQHDSPQQDLMDGQKQEDGQRSDQGFHSVDIEKANTNGYVQVSTAVEEKTLNRFVDTKPTPTYGSSSMLTHGIRHNRGASSRRVRRRLVHKNGECNISQVNVAKRKRQYLADIFTTLVDIKWRWNLMVFTLSFLLTWLIYAVIWWLICFAHGDLEHPSGDPKWKPCVSNINSFTSAFLYSLESQHTIGYGYRYITEECPEAIFVLCMQSVTGVVIQSFMVGVVFAKLSRPKKRAETLMFSKNAVICKRDGKLCLLFRVGDMRKSHIIEAHVRAQLIKKKVTLEGEVLPFHQFDVDVGYNTGADRIFLVWPLTISHEITQESPFYEMSAEDLMREKFELIIILEGVVESTGMTTQARTSYLPGEILWGHRLERLVTYQKEDGEYQIDYSRFHDTYATETPTCSAKELEEIGELASENKTDESSGSQRSKSTSLDSLKRNNNTEFMMPPSPEMRTVALQTDFSSPKRESML